MPTLALVVYVLFLLLAFGLRTWIQLRRTGASGFHGISGRPGSVEWAGGALFVLSIVAGLAAPIAQLAGVVGPVAVLDRPGVAGVGLALALVGIAATLAAQTTMGDSWRIGVDPSERTALVTTGAFRLARNPIFVAMVAAALGLALLTPNAIALGAVLALMVAVEIQVRVIEEPHLRASHPEAFAAYAALTGRFGPVSLRRRLPQDPARRSRTGVG